MTKMQRNDISYSAKEIWTGAIILVSNMIIPRKTEDVHTMNATQPYICTQEK